MQSKEDLRKKLQAIVDAEDKRQKLRENAPAMILNEIEKVKEAMPKAEDLKVTKKISTKGIQESIASLKPDLQKTYDATAFINGFINSLKGETPVKGVDYFTEEDIQEIASRISNSGSDAADETPEALASKLNTLKEAIEPAVIKDFPTVQNIIEALKKLKGNDRLDISAIRNSEQLLSRKNVNTNRIGGAGVTKIIAGSGITISSGSPAATGMGDVTINSTGGGGISRSVNNISTPQTAGSTANTDYVYNISGTTTLTMPTAVANTNRYSLKNSGVNTVTIAFTGGQTGDGSATLSLPVANTSLDLISNGSNWFIY